MRQVNLVSAPELQRRWQAVREHMRAEAVDALVVQNSSDWVGGYCRWFCGEPATNGYSTALVFPLEGLSSLIEQGPFGGVSTPDAEEQERSGIGRRLTTPAYPCAISSAPVGAISRWPRMRSTSASSWAASRASS